jgi:hypothetical protein
MQPHLAAVVINGSSSLPRVSKKVKRHDRLEVAFGLSVTFGNLDQWMAANTAAGLSSPL